MRGIGVKILAVVSILMVLMCSVACTAQQDKAYAANEKFKLNDNTFVLEKLVRLPDLDKGSSEGYGLCLLMVDDNVPVIINGANMTSGISMYLTTAEDDTIESTSVDYDHQPDVSGYSVRATFSFLVPSEGDFPQSAALYDVQDKENKVLLDISQLKAE